MTNPLSGDRLVGGRRLSGGTGGAGGPSVAGKHCRIELAASHFCWPRSGRALEGRRRAAPGLRQRRPRGRCRQRSGRFSGRAQQSHVQRRVSGVYPGRPCAGCSSPSWSRLPASSPTPCVRATVPMAQGKLLSITCLAASPRASLRLMAVVGLHSRRRVTWADRKPIEGCSPRVRWRRRTALRRTGDSTVGLSLWSIRPKCETPLVRVVRVRRWKGVSSSSSYHPPKMSDCCGSCASPLSSRGWCATW